MFADFIIKFDIAADPFRYTETYEMCAYVLALKY